MDLLPDWAPNVHPLIVHFPIGILATAALADLAGLVLRRRGIRTGATSLYVLGALTALVAYLTGRDAADSLDLPATVIPAVSDHADWAEWTVWFFGVYALVRIALSWFDARDRRWAQGWGYLLLALVGAGGYYLVVETGEHGSRLVFEHGAGVQPVMEQAAEQSAAEPEPAPGEIVGVQAQDGGSWLLVAGQGAARIAEEDIDVLQGSYAGLWSDAAADSALALKVSGQPVLFAAGTPIESVQARTLINTDGFTGTVRLLHHVRDARNYDYVELADGRMRLGRLTDGTMTVFDDKPVQAGGWIDLRAVGDGTHFRGYLGSEMITHGHGDAAEAGSVGLYLDGSGTVQLRRLSAESLR